jgi:Domain of unknown function (DUF5615)
MSQFQFLLDEHVGAKLQRALLRRQRDMLVWHIGDAGAPPRGTPDPEILLWCERDGYSLVTNNRASMPVHLRDHLALRHHVPGIFTLNDDMSIGETVEELFLLWTAADPVEYADQLNYLPVSK